MALQMMGSAAHFRASPSCILQGARFPIAVPTIIANVYSIIITHFLTENRLVPSCADGACTRSRFTGRAQPRSVRPSVRTHVRTTRKFRHLQPSCAASTPSSGGDYTTELAAAERRWEDQVMQMAFLLRGWPLAADSRRVAAPSCARQGCNCCPCMRRRSGRGGSRASVQGQQAT